MRTLAGLDYKPHSPSLYELAGYPVAIIMDASRSWHIWTGPDGLHPRPLASLEEAAQLIANALKGKPC